jgi:hypothetical protein
MDINKMVYDIYLALQWLEHIMTTIVRELKGFILYLYNDEPLGGMILAGLFLWTMLLLFNERNKKL